MTDSDPSHAAPEPEPSSLLPNLLSSPFNGATKHVHDIGRMEPTREGSNPALLTQELSHGSETSLSETKAASQRLNFALDYLSIEQILALPPIGESGYESTPDPAANNDTSTSIDPDTMVIDKPETMSETQVVAVTTNVMAELLGTTKDQKVPSIISKPGELIADKIESGSEARTKEQITKAMEGPRNTANHAKCNVSVPDSTEANSNPDLKAKEETARALEEPRNTADHPKDDTTVPESSKMLVENAGTKIDSKTEEKTARAIEEFSNTMASPERGSNPCESSEMLTDHIEKESQPQFNAATTSMVENISETENHPEDSVENIDLGLAQVGHTETRSDSPGLVTRTNVNEELSSDPGQPKDDFSNTDPDEILGDVPDTRPASPVTNETFDFFDDAVSATDILENKENLLDNLTDSNLGEFPDTISVSQLRALAYLPEDSIFEAGDFEDEHASKYALRANARNTTIGSTWMDQDETENYDPKQDRRVEKMMRQKAQARRLRRKNDSGDEGPRVRAEPEAPPVIMVELKIFSEWARESVQKILATASKQDLKSDFNTGYGLRTRSKIPQNDISDFSTSSQEEVMEDLTGHPVARGCHGCKELGIKCSLLFDEDRWPCESCSSDGDHECILLREALYKQACESCRKSRGGRAGCSYTYTADHSGPCHTCQKSGSKCYAGPLKDQIPTRARYDRNWIEFPAKPQRAPPGDKKEWTCRQCRATDKVCSFRFTYVPGSKCNSCDGYDLDCSRPEHIAIGAPLRPSELKEAENLARLAEQKASSKQESVSKKALTRVAPRLKNPKPTPKKRKAPEPLPAQNRQLKRVKSSGTHKAKVVKPVKPPKIKTSKGQEYTIWTKFRHPMVFQHKPQNDEDQCDFCDGFAVQILGEAHRRIRVKVRADGLGLDEISMSRNPHRVERDAGGAGGAATAVTRPTGTKVCKSCTLSRVSIINCRGHRICKRPNADTMDVAGAMQELDEGRLRSGDVWCLLCANLAGYECFEPFRGAREGDDRAGCRCGLALCEKCARFLSRQFGGRLNKLLEAAEEQPAPKWAEEYRADWCLLKPDGLLVQYMKNVQPLPKSKE